MDLYKHDISLAESCIGICFLFDCMGIWVSTRFGEYPRGMGSICLIFLVIWINIQFDELKI